MKKTYIQDIHNHKGESITLAGWVDTRRDHGKLIFIDLRDATGLVQMVALPNHESAHAIANTVRSEWVIEVTGVVNERPTRMVNPDEPNGDVEIEITDMTVITEAQTPPFEVNKDTADIAEDTRLLYRYLDLRSARMQKNIKTRAEFVRRCRAFLEGERFTEIETPLLTEATAEGARDFVVPSRLHPGSFYALPQSPQQYKQLLMTAGFERYFQTARCIRDEDLRADRGFEHTQIDIEMSFVTRDDILSLVEAMIIEVVEAMGHTIKEKPFPRIPYTEAMEKYGDDKFDLRTEEEKAAGVLAYAWVVDFPFFEKTEEGGWTFTHNPFSAPIAEHEEWLMRGEHIEDIIAAQYDLVCNGYESGGGSIRAHNPDMLRATYKIMGYTDEQIEKSVGHMLTAFTYGAPPHGGIALGVERNVMNLTHEATLRDVQAFPMSRGGQTAVMKGPKPLADESLKGFGLKKIPPHV